MAKLTMRVLPFTDQNIVRAADAISQEIARRGLEDDKFRQWVMACGNGTIPIGFQFRSDHPFRKILDNLYKSVADDSEIGGNVYYYILKDAVRCALKVMDSQLA